VPRAVQVRAATAADLPLIGQWLGRTVALPADPAPHEAADAGAAADAKDLLLVAADEADRALAALRLVPAIGLGRPRVAYHVGCTVHAAPELGLFHRQRTLLLGHDHTGASELADIAWDPALDALRSAQALARLVQGALLHIAAARGDYAPRLVAELPGLRDAAGSSPFWQGLGRHFYAGDPAAAAATHGPAWRGLVASLLPRQPVYASFLPPAAEAAIAQVAPAAALLREVLEDAGLRYGHHVNVEDGGPILEAETDTLNGVAGARVLRLQATARRAADATPWLLQLPGAARRALRVRGHATALALQLPAAEIAALQLDPGARAWAVPLREGG
jgi:arginine N-succinyltransferase